MNTIAGKAAVVTGAASGIGQAIAEELAGHEVKGLALVDRSPAVFEVAARINGNRGTKMAHAYEGDTTNEGFRREVYDRASQEMGLINLCIPAAGITRDRLAAKISKETGKAMIYPVEDFRLTTEVNLIAPVYWALEMLARIAEWRWQHGLKQWEPSEDIQGVAIFIGSVSSQGNQGQIAYAAAKAGLQGAASTLMKEAMYHGVRCMVIHPGFTDTPMVHQLDKHLIEQKILPATLLRRLIKPEEIAHAVCFMIENPSVTGEIWADAGWHPSV